jgi:hypothetical protein
MDAIYNSMGVRVPGMFKKGGSAPKGYHFMPDGTLMKDSDHKMKKGGPTKDACYKKVKSRYNIWPSGYASAALGKCRKVGASNWGNKSKK